MTAILRATLLAALAASSVPAVATGQGTSTDSLLRRIDLLERRTADLEQRVRELEVLIKTEPEGDRSVPASAKWRDLGNWRRIRVGMTMDEVRTSLGEPETVRADELRTYWYWDYPLGAEVYIDTRSRKLGGWTEPRR